MDTLKTISEFLIFGAAYFIYKTYLDKDSDKFSPKLFKLSMYGVYVGLCGFYQYWVIQLSEDIFKGIDSFFNKSTGSIIVDVVGSVIFVFATYMFTWISARTDKNSIYSFIVMIISILLTGYYIIQDATPKEKVLGCLYVVCITVIIHLLKLIGYFNKKEKTISYNDETI